MSSSEPKKLKIILIGKTGAGKTSTMEILSAAVKKNLPLSPCKTETAKFGDPELIFVDTPGLCQPGTNDEDVLEEIAKSIFQADSGPHVFLYVYKWEQRIKSNDNDQVKLVKKIFGKESGCYFVPLITCKNEQALGRNCEKLKEFIKEHFGVEPKEYCLTKDGDKDREAENLLNKITEVTKHNKHYPKDMFEKTPDLHKEEQDSNDKAQTDDGNQSLAYLADSFPKLMKVPKEVVSQVDNGRKSFAKVLAKVTAKVQTDQK
ncbi:GTPase IMAP family member 7-like [Archocentrus centrarchus]|uniref:GTPase IMAP family member 7-like n=1 Tax=Archocentrus centrarchus TaxID=63155 RepID=UPI0011E9CACC|nr:GTPase IMAP family member 7-like [Archocentrus centrarchus]